MSNDKVQEFIAKARLVHGDRYDYSTVTEYLGTKVKLPILCPTHGIFYQKPEKHLSGQNCPRCAPNYKMSTDDFIRKANVIHNNTYDYIDTNYTGNSEVVHIKCTKHGEFSMTANQHISGYGCKLCTYDRLSLQYRSNTDEFIRKAILIHSTNKYNYSAVNYINSKTPVDIICSIHGVFRQTPADHLSGRGCAMCGNINKMKAYLDRPTTLYYIKLSTNSTIEYKIGITTSSISSRFASDINRGVGIQVLMSKIFDTGLEAYTAEQLVLDIYSKFRITSSIIHGGRTECFSTDILQLDKELKNE